MSPVDLALIVGAFVLILVGAEVFTNGIEWLGIKLRISAGATGSILAAFGTATPETLIPIIAIVFTNTPDADEIGVGAILGAPFMLGTLVMLLIGATAFVMRKRRGRDTLHVDTAHALRDMSFFLVMYGLAVALALLPPLATELPEAANSLVWTRQGKDVIALGNVAGAMVFQSTIPVTVGVLLTAWDLGPSSAGWPFGLMTALFALVSGALIWMQLRTR